nr:type III secretion system translocon protein [Chromobacterium sphagni]
MTCWLCNRRKYHVDHTGSFHAWRGLPGDWAEKEEGKSGATRKVSDAANMVSRPLAEVKTQQLGQLASPRAAKEPVSRQQAADALGRITRTIDQASGNVGTAKGPTLSLSAIEKIPMDSMIMASTLMTSQMLGDTAATKSKALDIMSKKQDALRKQEVENIREQMSKAIEQQDKAKKAGILSVVFDWVVAAVEVVTGVAKMIGGVMTGNAMQAAGGAMDLVAGMAGLVKAMANTMALVDPENAEKYRKVADVAGKIQLSFEIAGAVVDVTSAARNLLVTKMIPKVAGKVLKEGAEQMVSTAIKKGTAGAAKNAANAVGKQVADQVATQVAQALGKAAVDAAKTTTKKTVEKFAQKFTNQMLERFTHEAIEKLVSKSVEKVIKKAVKEGVELTAQEVTKRVVNQVFADVVKATIKATLKAPALVVSSTVRGVATGARDIMIGEIEKQRAKLQKEIDLLILDQQWLRSFFEFYEQEKKEVIKKTRELLNDKGQVFEDGVQAMGQAASTQAQIASAMV